MIYFTDAGTSLNGHKGHQKTRIAIFTENNDKVLEEFIGDYSNNEGELIAIGRALQLFGVTEIKTDSVIAMNWAVKGWTERNQKSFDKKKLTNRHRHMINKAHDLYLKAGCKITWIPREENLAGHYLEDTYSI